MANKTTSQEVDGVYVENGDLFRIARGGTNYKLETEGIFNETLTKNDFVALAASNNLIVGRKYTVTGTGAANDQTILVTALTGNTYSTSNHQYSTDTYLKGSMVVMDIGLNQNASVLDNRGNLIQGPYTGSYDSSSSSILNNIVYFSGNASAAIINSKVIGGSFVLNDSQIVNSSINNSNVICDATYCGINTSTISNATINLKNGAIINNCTIIGDAVAGATYTFDGVTIENATIIAGKFSTVTVPLDRQSAFNPATDTITVPADTDYVGVFELTNYQPGDTIQYIDMQSGNSHTPIRFSNKSSTVINTVHINKPSDQSTNYEMMFSVEVKTHDDLHTTYSYMEGKYDPNSLLWVFDKFVDYD
jgi:hypothetical protein